MENAKAVKFIKYTTASFHTRRHKPSQGRIDKFKKGIGMQTLSKSDYQRLRKGAEVIEADGHGDKVLRLRDGSFVKLFRRKRLISSAVIWPYAKRFAKNAEMLKSLNLPCPQVIQVYRCPELQRDIVHYQPLPGRTLRQLNKNELTEELFSALGELIATLHKKGVYFRSLHLGNIVLTPENKMGLIDLADLSKSCPPLSAMKRLRNFKHLLRDERDRTTLTQPAATACFDRYCQESALAPDGTTLKKRLKLL
jgi:tRNA A-37 threonylcarbamoyl transferase component Bud32